MQTMNTKIYFTISGAYEVYNGVYKIQAYNTSMSFFFMYMK